GIAHFAERHSLPLCGRTQHKSGLFLLKKTEQCISSYSSAIVTRRIWIERYMISSPDSLQFAVFSIYSAIFSLQAYSFGYFTFIISASSFSSFGRSSLRYTLWSRNFTWVINRS